MRPFRMKDSKPATNQYIRLKILAIFLTLAAGALFVYFILQVGLAEIWNGIGRVGPGGFVLIFLVYSIRSALRSLAWCLSVESPYGLRFRDAFQAVIIGEAMSSLIPLGIFVSGMSKALAVRHKLPLVIGLSSLAVENLFYSLGTGLFIAFGAIQLLLNFNLSDFWFWTSALLVAIVAILLIGGFVMIVRQWHFASAVAGWLYEKGFLRFWLATGRADIKFFEDRIYGFYRRQPRRFLPICLLEAAFHLLGVLEVWLILFFIGEIVPTLFSAFLLESVSRVIAVIFKLVPFVLGVDEAAAQFITEILQLGGGLGVTLAVVRKGGRVFWAAIGVLLLVRRGLSIGEIFQNSKSSPEEDKKFISPSEQT